MEIVLLSSDSIRIKGKSCTIVVNPQNKSVPLQVAILIAEQQGKNFVSDEGIIIDGPGEYEVGGVKISGTRGKDARLDSSEKTESQARPEVVYSMSVDGVAIAVGTLEALSEAQQKIKEHNIVVAFVASEIDASFITNIAVNGAVFYGPESSKVVSNFAKEGVREMPKYVATLDKLPTEMETVLLK